MSQRDFFSTPSEDLAESSSSLDKPCFQHQEPPKTKIYSVVELNKAAKTSLEGIFSGVEVQGEISNFKKHISGHCYFSLKDEQAQLRSVMFKGSHARLNFQMRNGLEVRLKGKISLYEARGDYQFICSSARPVGVGDLQLAFERLKAKLAKEKIFEQKRPLPLFPKKILLITSPTGAALQDMLNIFRRRLRTPQILLYPCLVQGKEAPSSLLKAVQESWKMKDLDLIIIGRGGGSMEDLWCFNDEALVRALYKSSTPTISAVGHEIDFTLSDFVCDKRAPTPSAAAELAVRDEADILTALASKQQVLTSKINQDITRVSQKLVSLSQSLRHPKEQLEFFMQKLDDLWERLTAQVRFLLKDKGQALVSQAQILDGLSPLRVLERGYGLILKKGQVLGSVNNIKEKDELEIRLKDGLVKTEVTEIEK